METISFREQAKPGDVEHVRHIVASTGFFRQDEMDVAVELITDAVEKGPSSGYYFVFSETQDHVSGFACFGAIPCTIGSYDLYWIAVHRQFQHKNIGSRLLLQVEKAIKTLHGRQLFIETSSTEKYAPTRSFYLRAGYREAARLQDFYLPGDDKIIYVKSLLH